MGETSPSGPTRRLGFADSAPWPFPYVPSFGEHGLMVAAKRDAPAVVFVQLGSLQREQETSPSVPGIALAGCAVSVSLCAV